MANRSLQTGIRVPPCFRDRDHVEYGEALYLFWVVQRETVGDPAAAIVPNEVEFRESEVLHGCDEFARHRPL